eukprot:CAMPEP_0170468628 /NCGR_PEP_ID=MMETSP0123-20130129/11733_1 /TAXON_ID=182087 /ORGANISM="Favella ehrenbergii, Strain Fehren 1" /LENGTH=74 /DNA_ID=CAMNT_0010735237 /DNA_START=503 /DNA_END=727 /DNA_ORIENTATION=-
MAPACAKPMPPLIPPVIAELAPGGMPPMPGMGQPQPPPPPAELVDMFLLLSMMLMVGAFYDPAPGITASACAVD